MPAILFVCVTCRGSKIQRESQPADTTASEHEPHIGAQLLAAIENVKRPDGVEVRAVECLSTCDNGCAVALSYPGKWSYVYRDMTLEDAKDILAGASAYSASSDGLVPWRERPTIFRKQCQSRMPPNC